MKRLHVHVTVPNIEESVKFYSTLFGAQPIKLKSDYAKWLLEDPKVNFAISSRNQKTGFDHFGIQVEEDSELNEVRERLSKADVKTFDEGETTCCYAKAEKSWVMDPAGLPWETYKMMEDAETFGTDRKEEPQAAACCAPTTVIQPQKKSSGCCG